MEPKRIIMNFTVPPSLDDIEAMAEGILDTLPEELLEYCENLAIQVEEFPDDTTTQDSDVDDPYDLTGVYKSGKQIAPGVEKKTTDEEDILVLYRGAVLDMWCETQDDLGRVLRQVIIEEIARQNDFTDDEIDTMIERHYQGLL